MSNKIDIMDKKFKDLEEKNNKKATLHMMYNMWQPMLMI